MLGGALDDGVRPDPDRRRKQVFDAFFNVIKSDETYAREMCRFCRLGRRRIDLVELPHLVGDAAISVALGAKRTSSDSRCAPSL